MYEYVEGYWRPWKDTGDLGRILETVEGYWRPWKDTGDRGRILEKLGPKNLSIRASRNRNSHVFIVLYLNRRDSFSTVSTKYFSFLTISLKFFWNSWNTCNVEKVKREIEKDRWKMIGDVADSINISRTNVHKILRQNLEMKLCVWSWFWKSWCRNKRKNESRCKNVFERLRGGSGASWKDHYGWWVVGFWIWSIHNASVNAVEEERRTMVQKSSHGSVPAEIDVNIIFRRLRCADGRMGAASEKCRHAFYIKMLWKLRICIWKKRPELWVENLFVLHHDNAPSHRAESTQKFLQKNNMWLMLHPPYSPDLASCDIFIFPKLNLVLNGQHLGDSEGIKLKTAAYCRAFPNLTSKGVMTMGYSVYGSVWIPRGNILRGIKLICNIQMWILCFSYIGRKLSGQTV